MMFGFSYAQKAYFSATYKGKIGKYPIIMELVQGDSFYGDYFYLSKNKKITLSTDDNVNNKGKVILYEKVNNVKTGFFVFNTINFDKASLRGKWYSIDGSKSYDVVLYQINR
jgi:hypothetical protein